MHTVTSLYNECFS